ncbi:MAG TPA: hypothetical protein VKD72_14035, partial [Gemmataceae bacterium]|nr:hypothetical protein [Gemmataceae bacterium]
MSLPAFMQLNGTSESFAVVGAEIALKGLLLLGAASLAALAMRRTSAAARHLLWTCAIVALLGLPLFSHGLPPIRVELPARVAAVPLLQAAFGEPGSATAGVERRSESATGAGSTAV